MRYGFQVSTFDEALAIMTERFGKDTLIAIATTDGESLYNRIVDAYYEDGAFYISTNAASSKMQQIAQHPDVAIAAIDWFTGHGVAENLGWVLKRENAEVRNKIRHAFSEWYDAVNDEQDQSNCILKITLTDGMLVKDHFAVRYQIDFSNKTAKASKNWGPFEET